MPVPRIDGSDRIPADVTVTFAAARPEVVEVTVSLTIEVTSFTPPASTGSLLRRLYSRRSLGRSRLCKRDPPSDLRCCRVVVPGAVTMSPPPGAENVTTIVALPARADAGFTTIVPVVPGPVAVLEVTATVAVAVNVVACIVPGADRQGN